MPGPFGGRRRRIRAAYDALCDAMALADGAIAAAAEAARQEHMLATVELLLREEGLDRAAFDEELRPLLRNPALADVVAAIGADRSTSALRPAQALPELDEIVAKAAPGSAGSPPEDWLGKVGGHSGGGGVPELWRIGAGRLGTAGEPFEVAVPLLDEAHLQIGAAPQARPIALGLVENLVMRVVSHFRPGLVTVHLWDVAQISGPLPRLHPLTRTGIAVVHDPRGLSPLLDLLSDRVRRVHRRVLAEGETSMAGWTANLRPAERPEPWTLAVLVGDRTPLREEETAALARIARGGLACGIQLVLLDVPITLAAAVETVRIEHERPARASIAGPYGEVEIEPRFDGDAVTRACGRIADEHESWRNRITTLEDLRRMAKAEKPSSQDGLEVPVGFDDAGPVALRLDDASPHALVGGPSGSGKTNLLLAWISALATRYPPDELELYLLDFKEGVSFAQFTSEKEKTFLPHARLLGLHVNTDREFGVALLEHLAGEMRRRAAAAKDHGVAKLADLRALDTTGRWPRMVAVIDEFQYLFNERDAVSRAAGLLLEDVARRGRSQGIHLVLASQDVSGIDAFWGRPAIFEQFVLRVALPRARRVLDDRHNEAALDLPRWHAVVNHESGLRHDNRIARIPDASARGLVDDVRRELHALHPDADAPAVFDGSRMPPVDELVRGLAPGGPPLAVIGQCIDVLARPATVALPVVPGRNLAVLGTGGRAATAVLEAAARGIAATTGPEPPAAPRPAFLLAALIGEAAEAAAGLAASVKGTPLPLDALRTTVLALAKDVATARETGGRVAPTVLVLYGADAADAVLGRDGTEALKTLLHSGPETGVHVLGWWRTVPRLKNLLMMGAVVDDVGAWVALDVQGAELQPLLPGALLSWSPRAGRGLFFDRSQHSAPHVVVVPGGGG